MIKDENFFTISGWMLNKMQLKGNELMIYAIIYGFSQGDNTFNGSLQYLADWTNSTRRGVMKNIDSLLEKGLIAREPTVINGRKGYKYHVTDTTGEQSSQVNKVHVTGEQSSPYCRTKFTFTGEQSSHNNITNTNSDRKNDIYAEFESIWKLYPRKEGKSNAYKSYVKARKDGETKESILDGLNRYLTQIKAENTPTQYIKHGSTWFNQRCWHDEYRNELDEINENRPDYLKILKIEDNEYGGETRYYADGYIRVYDGYDMMVKEIKPK
jgi:DNA-binding MarR family transcriptional regulator